MSDSNPFFEDIQAVNAEVQAWYAGTTEPAALDRLMAHFSPQFSMILPNGATLDRPMLREMNHSPRFWETVESIFPEFREARQTLKHHPPELLPTL